MALITIYFDPPEGIPAPLGYIKAIVDDSQADFFRPLGFRRTQEKPTGFGTAAPKPEAAPKPTHVPEDPPTDPEPTADGDGPTGEFGSFIWHKNKIAEMETRGDVMAYAKDLGVKVKLARSLDETKERALAAISDKMTDPA